MDYLIARKWLLIAWHPFIYFIFLNKVRISMINRNTSPTARLQVVEPATVYRSLSPEPPVYYEQKE